MGVAFRAPEVVRVDRAHDVSPADVRRVFASPVLRCVTLDDAPPTLELLAASAAKNTKLTQLFLYIHADASHPSLLRALTTVTKLTVRCEAKLPSSLLQSPLVDGSSDNRLGKLMPQLRDLDLTCDAQQSGTLIFSVIAHTPALQHVTLHRPLTRDALPALQAMQVSLHVEHIDAVYHAQCLSPALVTFCTFRLIHEEDLGVLAGCVQLRNLHVRVARGSEMTLAALEASLADANGQQRKRSRDEREAQGMQSIVNALQSGRGGDDSDGGGRAWRHVVLYGFRAEQSEVSAIVRAVAPHVHTFGMSVDRQDDDLLTRLAGLCDALRGNGVQRLTRVALREFHSVLRAQREAVDVAIARLRRVFPTVNFTELQQLAERVF